MSTEAAARLGKLCPFEQLRCARQIIEQESQTLAQLAKRLDHEFCRAVERLFACRGSVIVSGMGKGGLGQKIMATLASTGTRSHCLHSAEAVHGDLGRIDRDDFARWSSAVRQSRRRRSARCSSAQAYRAGGPPLAGQFQRAFSQETTRFAG